MVRDLVQYLSQLQASCVIVSEFRHVRAALYLDIYHLSNLIRPWYSEGAKPGRGKPVLIMYIGIFACFHDIFPNAVILAKSPRYLSCPCSTEAVGIAHKPPSSM